MKIPLINTALITSPMNWAIILLMLTVGGFAVTILTNRLLPAPDSNEG
jgi:hypothetical protein